MRPGEQRSRATSSLRRRLYLLAVLAMVPIALMSAVALQLVFERQRSQTEQAALNLARALATSIDNELSSSVATLEALALSNEAIPAADGDDGAAPKFATDLLASRKEWSAIQLLRPDARVVWRTDASGGGEATTSVDLDSLREVLRSKRSIVGSLSLVPPGPPSVPIRVPVVRDGQPTHVLTAALRPEAVAGIIGRQKVPSDWVVAVFDAQRHRVARSREAGPAGAAPSESLARLMSALGPKGEIYGISKTVEGNPAHTALARIGTSGWLVVLGIPTEATFDSIHDSLLRFGGGLLVSIILGGGGAWLFSRSIVVPMAQLGVAASALGRRQPIVRPKTTISEIETVFEALENAGLQLARSGAEREVLLANERHARTAAEASGQRLKILAEASSSLAGTLEEGPTLEAVGSLLVPDVCDVLRIDLLDEHGRLERKLTRHSDPEREAIIQEFVRQHVASAQTPGSFPWVVATGQSYLADYESTPASPSTDPAFQAFIETVGLRSVFAVPLVARGRIIGALGAMQAHSGRRFAQEDTTLVSELAQRVALVLDNLRLFSEARAALAKAREAAIAKDEFLAMLGHELRNPLAPILAAVELMKRRHGQVAVYEREVIHRQVKHLSRMVDDLLDVSRITSGKIRLQLERIDLRDVARRAVELTEPAFEGRLAPSLVFPPHAVLVTGDFLRLTQVVSNLLINAAKFSNRDTPVTITIAENTENVRLTVADEGVGIRPDLLPRVFDRFVQDGQTLQRAAGGLGLGLAIAKSLVELHGGAIGAESSGENLGSSFTMTLPVTSAAAPAAPAQTGPASIDTPEQFDILMVDDNADAVAMLAALLRDHGHRVDVVGSAEEALGVLAHRRYAVAVIDIGLPGMSGYDLAREIRRRPDLAALELIALTGYGQDTDRAMAIRVGFAEHAVKPIQAETLLASIRAVLVRAKSSTAA